MAALVLHHPIISARQFHLIHNVAPRSSMPADVVVWSGSVADALSVPVAVYGADKQVFREELP